MLEMIVKNTGGLLRFAGEVEARMARVLIPQVQHQTKMICEQSTQVRCEVKKYNSLTPYPTSRLCG